MKSVLAMGLLMFWVCGTTQAVILDDEPPPKPAVQAKPKPKPAPCQKSAAELENKRLKKELATLKQQQEAEKRRQAEKRQADSPIIEMVDLPIGIAMGKYEVTQGQWRAVIGSNPSHFSNCGDRCPVEEVSWYDVQYFIERLNQKTGKRYRLPTENEWYAACQAGSYGSEYCGSNNIDAVAWYENNSGYRTHPVGQKKPNAWGLYDMSGNVWEWTDSCFENDCSRRAFRGGSWSGRSVAVRSAGRFGDMPSVRFSVLGFRLAQDP